ncbi:MAG: NADH-quinone oxidoreductase subunit L, partial [Bacteroidota bacterium]
SFLLSSWLILSGQEFTAQYTWLKITETRSLAFGLKLDGLSQVITLVVTLVSLIVHLFSVGYMKTDPGVNRYFSYLGIFTFSMLGIVLYQSLFMIFFFWELVGFTSYLLIGFWFKKPSATQASKKAFIVNRIGDIGFLAGIAILWSWFGTTNIDTLQSFFAVAESNATSWSIGSIQVSNLALTGVALALFCGVIGKSAQFPLQVWLPDAMEGPTPVSALIHAATMVAAGVFLLARVYFVFPPEALTLVAYVGAITALIGAISAMAQTDIKKVLAFSTISQLGYMVLAMGVGAWFAALFHLVTHAFFKAALFLSSGSVIHSLHQWEHDNDTHIDAQDMKHMGGLNKHMPVTFATYTIAMLSLAGLPLFSGFLSKDAIIVESWLWASASASSIDFIVPLIALLTALLTAIYMGRQLFMVFFSKNRLPELGINPKEVPAMMKWPTVLLAVLSLGIFYSINPLDGTDTWLANLLVAPENILINRSVSDGHSIHLMIGAITVVLAIAGIGFAYQKYLGKAPIAPDALSALGRLSYHQLYFNQVYQTALVVPFEKMSRGIAQLDRRAVDGVVNALGVTTVVISQLLGWMDRYIVDGAVNAMAWLSGRVGQLTRSLQGGNGQSYLLWGILGVMLIIVWLFQFIQWRITY